MGFLPNGDLILVSSGYEYKSSEYEIRGYTRVTRPYKIYCYSVENKPTTNTTFWKCSQIYNIELSESLKGHFSYFLVYQTKLFFINTDKRLMFQWNLSSMTFDMQYFLDDFDYSYELEIVINKNQTLLTLNINYHIFYVFSMEAGTLISKYG